MNGFKLVSATFLAGMLLVTALPVFIAEVQAQDRTASINPRPAAFNAQAALRSVNAYRVSHGLAPVQLDSKVMAAAAAQSQAMASTNNMSHSAGGGFSGRMAEHGINRGKAVENIAMGQRSFDEVFEAWKGSHSHDVNLRASGVTKLGVGVTKGPSGLAWTLILVGDSFW